MGADRLVRDLTREVVDPEPLGDRGQLLGQAFFQLARHPHDALVTALG